MQSRASRPASLRRFVKDVMGLLMHVEANASVKSAAKKMLDNGFTRLGVFDGDKRRWVTLADIARCWEEDGHRFTL